ncbi:MULTISPECIES: UDP-N-acetylglucosamine 1-carboxyvinyltransferase [Treponema]|uniref:UDP-N-acetylglucosamine 1-carboxyvinyltransferase n=1 Tax=Treponema berlinense TaxID=225004 RepID=A0A1T4PJC6_9SPIR|nr:MULTISPECIES: UDP-N-acetylglucosamine 1-carboxyvinyltransferase [Treponema]MBQ9101977.1 UDP-N-acetylglucosamine 1-carboxyvinyltransferase [Treponema sp.]MCI5540911.1 UDP-N-acetylglucosamine 1-carboxyvinyltransferase [Treponema berlinense]MDD5834515.1 UDP-N-acetylglucosamine 1-carboxyvinyltransferase [Treponema berlinense]MDY3708101.1 UDP-N-acetylglucosamine 1-carboxyvinyltransferase [Treponema berlinense]SJZ91572.1 UDP-N-acetylglucosamine 1-carboxyvinyltransferase [Treponema berlinense]
MFEYKIEGGIPIRGTVKASGNKNSALPCIASSLLTDETVILRNIPDIEDTSVMISILQSLGASVEKIEHHTWKIEAKKIEKTDIPSELSKKIRASILFAGPLVARAGKAVMPPPGGDVIGRRRLDTHFLALQELGARITVDGPFTFTANKLVGADLFLDETSVTATENAVMAAVLAEGRTKITNAASEPHVQDLCNMLVAMGAKISGIGSNILVIDGVKKLHGVDFSIGPDFMEIGSYIGLAAATKGSITITGVRAEDMRPLRVAFGKLGITWTIEGDTLTVAVGQEMKVNTDLGGMIPKIDDSPWPGFPPDLTSIMTVVATQVEGTVLIFEKMFESRMFFVDKLISMGARITLCDPHRAVVSGPSTLHGDNLVSPDVRAGMAMVIAAMAAHGESTISNIYQIERGYEHLVEKLQSLGAHIKRVEIS